MATEQTPLLISKVSPWINPYEYILNTNKGDFVYVPQDVVNKGYVAERYEFTGSGADLRQTKEKRQYFHPEFLNQNLLSAAGRTKIDENLFTDAQKSEMSNLVGGDINTGYLFPVAQYMSTVSGNPSFYTLDEDSPPISGVSSLSSQGVGGTAFDSGYKYILGTPSSNNFDFINPDASINTLTTTYTAPKKRGGILGSAARSIVNVIADIPYLPEIAAFATGSPVLYGSLKAAQTAAAGGDLEETIKSGVVSGGTMYLGQQILGPGEAAAGGVEPGVGGLPSDYNVDPYGPGGEITPDTGGFPPNYNVEPYGPGGIVPAQPVDYGLLGGTNAYDAGGGLDVMNPPPAAPPMTAEQLAASNIDPLTREGMSAEQITKETINSPYYRAAQSNIDPSILEGMSAEQVASAPVLTSAGLASGAAASTIGLSDAFRGARLANSLINPPSAGGTGGVDSGGAQQTTSGVDYSGLYNLLAQRALAGGLLGTRYQPQSINLASLLG
jgi:hypothetical protein